MIELYYGSPKERFFERIFEPNIVISEICPQVLALVVDTDMLGDEERERFGFVKSQTYEDSYIYVSARVEDIVTKVKEILPHLHRDVSFISCTRMDRETYERIKEGLKGVAEERVSPSGESWEV